MADFLDKHFENDRIKAMLAFHAAICAYQPDIRGLAVSYPVLLGKITNWQLCRGGSHRLAHALQPPRDLAQCRQPALYDGRVQPQRQSRKHGRHDLCPSRRAPDRPCSMPGSTTAIPPIWYDVIRWPS